MTMAMTVPVNVAWQNRHPSNDQCYHQAINHKTGIGEVTLLVGFDFLGGKVEAAPGNWSGFFALQHKLSAFLARQNVPFFRRDSI